MIDPNEWFQSTLTSMVEVQNAGAEKLKAAFDADQTGAEALLRQLDEAASELATMVGEA